MKGVRRGEVGNISETWTKRIAPFRADGKPDLSSRGVSPFIRGNSTIFHIKITRTFTVPRGEIKFEKPVYLSPDGAKYVLLQSRVHRMTLNVKSHALALFAIYKL